MKKRIHIVAAIILSSDQRQLFITKRPDTAHQGGLWEFPGGKVESNESPEQAIKRELYEEVGIQVSALNHFQQLDYDYPDKQLSFDFYIIDSFDQEPYGKEGQEAMWVAVSMLTQYPFPAANIPILERVVAEYS